MIDVARQIAYANELAGHIEAQALAQSFRTFSEIGRGRDGGFYRIAYTKDDRVAHGEVAGRMRRAGMDVRTDAAGNTIGRLPGTDPALRPIVMGSHTDSVPGGGNYDGVLGVLGGLACIETLARGGTGLRHPVELIDFAAEEATMPGGTIGSEAMAGIFRPEALDARACDGLTLREHLISVGLDPTRVGEAERPIGSIAAYLELHVEQGGTLEADGLPIGVVAGIVGIRRYVVTVHGKTNHAGTTPMALRSDALVAAAPFILETPRIAVVHGIVATIGDVRVKPGSPNVIPGEVELDFEIRGLDEKQLDRAEALYHEMAQRCGATIVPISGKRAVRSATAISAAVETACTALDLPYRIMPSGAGHDAMCIERLGPQGMIFVPSQAGISHAPQEYTSDADCARGARVLMATLALLDAQLD